MKTEEKPNIFETIREWLTFTLALIGSVFGLISFFISRENMKINNRIDATILFNEAWDLIGGGVEGTDYILERGYTMDRNKLEIARRKIENAELLDPSSRKTHTTKGAYFLAMNQLNEAMNEYKIAKKIDPKSDIPLNNIAMIYFKQGKLDSALKEIQQAITINPKNPQLYSNAGYLLWKQGSLQEAKYYCNRAISIDSNHFIAYDNLAAVLQSEGKKDSVRVIMWRKIFREKVQAVF